MSESAPPCDSELSTGERPWVLLVDDGELGDVKQIAEELGATTLRKTLASRDEDWRQPQRLLVVSDRRALTLGRPAAQEEDHFVTLAILDEGSCMLRNQVAEMGFDYVLERGVDRNVLRQLVWNALYRGPEQRCERRLPVGLPVTVRVGWKWSRAELADLTRTACSLRVDSPFGAPSRIEVELPRAIAPERPATVRGRVFRERLQVGDGSLMLSVAFSHTALTQARVDAALEALRAGPPPSTLD
ncbi:MAG: hypothetical protein O7B29_10535 [Deltaproteobacteria bacterium]|nr:hypothetical protein [Deltaproteobacteria bacterium]